MTQPYGHNHGPCPICKKRMASDDSLFDGKCAHCLRGDIMGMNDEDLLVLLAKTPLLVKALAHTVPSLAQYLRATDAYELADALVEADEVEVGEAGDEW